ncbi:hypothetical protein LCGC14_1135960 [marine sediment metagenome]|uniref:Uncharacterized protein n=1 Tax=marine sediment metagenome TaxID=412755 RepID=A0A0F9PHX9_9ZZZZ
MNIEGFRYCFCCLEEHYAGRSGQVVCDACEADGCRERNDDDMCVSQDTTDPEHQRRLNLVAPCAARLRIERGETKKEQEKRLDG